VEQNDFMRLVMNPIRMRIIQFLLLAGEATTAQIGNELTDIPSATLYRQVKALEEGGILLVAQKRRVRGAVEKLYRLQENLSLGADKKEQAGLITSGLMSVAGQFTRYLSDPSSDLQRDGYFFTTSTLLLSDREFEIFLQALGTILQEALEHKPDGERKPRRITMISSPCEEE